MDRLSQPKLLFLCQTLPYPPDGGVSIRSFNVLRLLARHYDVTALCFYRRAVVRDVEKSLAALRRITPAVEAFPIEQEHSQTRLVLDHAVSVLKRRVYTVRAYESTAFRTRLRQLVATQGFDLVHVDSLDLSGYLPDLAGLPVICVHHNVESALLQRRAAVETSGLRRAYLGLQARLMEREERKWCPRVALNVVVSAADRDVFAKMLDGRFAVVPNGVDTIAFVPANEACSGVVFVGGMTWFPNKDALEYFTQEILPRLRALQSGVAVIWVGRALPGATSDYAARGVQLTGYVDDIRPFVDRAACYVVPLRVGGGTRLKILDAWAMGKAVVSTSVGCEGLDARDGWNILIRDDPEEFAAAIDVVLRDPAIQSELGRNARKTAENVYSWNVIDRDMYAAYEGTRSLVRNNGFTDA